MRRYHSTLLAAILHRGACRVQHHRRRSSIIGRCESDRALVQDLIVWNGGDATSTLYPKAPGGKAGTVRREGSAHPFRVLPPVPGNSFAGFDEKGVFRIAISPPC
jgi:hypothetical protein